MCTLAALFGAKLLLAAHDGDTGKEKGKDKTPPVITELRVESITNNSAVVMWTTNEPSDSDIKYGIDPHTNINGPHDPTLVLSHAIALSGLTLETTYAYCVTSRDESNNKTKECGTFVTTALPPPTPAEGGGGAWVAPNRIFVTGFAYPHAKIHAVLQQLPIGRDFEADTTADSNNGSFSVKFQNFPRGLYSFTIFAVDNDGIHSVRKGIQYEFKQANSALFREKVLMPPTITLGRDVIAWGDDIAVSGNTIPHTGVLVQAGNIFYETKSDKTGHYEILINSVRFAPGKLSIRVRSSLISDFGYDYSFSKTVTISSTSVPKADLNADGVVNMKDFSIFLMKPVDINDDNKVNAADLSIFLRAF